MSKNGQALNNKALSSKKLHITKKNNFADKILPFDGSIPSYRLVEEILNTTPFHLASTNSDGFFTTWNKSSETIFGYRKDEVVGKIKLSALHKDQDEADKVIETAVRSGEFHGEVMMARKNGDEFPAILDIKVMKDQSGHFSGFLASAIDISREKEVKKEYRESEEKHKHLFENSKDGIIYMDKDGTILDANKACVRISGYEISDIIGRNAFDLPFLFKRPESKIDFSYLLELGDIKTFELDILRHDKTKKIVEISINPVVTPEREKYFHVNIRDITPRKNAQKALKESESAYMAIFENTGAATMIIEEDETVSYANTQFINMSGYDKEQIVNKMKWFDFFSGDDVDMMKKIHKMRRENPYSAPRNYETRFVTKDGELRNVFLTAAVIPGTKKTVTSVLDITAKKIVENELRASKKLFDDLVEGSPVPMYVINTDHKVVYWNKAMEYLTGIPADQMIGTDYHWKLYYKKPTQQITDLLVDGTKWEDVMKLERYKDLEVEEGNIKKGIVCASYAENFAGGRKKWLRFKIKPLYDLNENIVGAVESIEDITASREMQKYLENRMREFQVLYRVSAHKRMVYSLNSVLESINKDLILACDVVDSARSRIVFDGKEYSTLKKGEKFVKKIEKPIKINDEVRGKIEMGYIEKIDSAQSMLMTHEKKVIDIISEIISKHVQSREFFERYQKLVTKSVTGIFISHNGVFQYVNPKLVRMFKYKKESDMIGMKFEQLLPGCKCQDKLIGNKKLTSAHCTLKAKRRDGQEITIDIFTQIIDYYGKRAILGTIQDITRIQEAQERQRNFNDELKLKIAEKTKDLQVANRRLLSLNELKDEFIAVTSHELRSPLTAARGYLSFLLSEDILGSMPKEARQYLVHVQDNVEVLNNLINNILDANRLEMGRFELHTTQVNIVALIKQIISNLSFQANERNINIQFNNKLNKDILNLNIDDIRIRQVLRNIIDNAIKFSPKGRPIIVELEMKGVGIQISVIDFGLGIRKSEIFDIFDKFKQGSSTQAIFKGGAGLGLFIAKRIMEMHNGMIWAESELRKGTTFRLQLPIDGEAGDSQLQISL